jgi:hypothetical protein
VLNGKIHSQGVCQNNCRGQTQVDEVRQTLQVVAWMGWEVGRVSPLLLTPSCRLRTHRLSNTPVAWALLHAKSKLALQFFSTDLERRRPLQIIRSAFVPFN